MRKVSAVGRLPCAVQLVIDCRRLDRERSFTARQFAEEDRGRRGSALGAVVRACVRLTRASIGTIGVGCDLPQDRRAT
jgi:hypothetical protein